VLAPVSNWWTVLGLSNDGWYELYQARSEQEGKQYLVSALDDDAPHMQRYEDFGLYPPQLTTPARPATVMSAAPAQHRRAGRVRRKVS
jgi:hypothetical protein